MKAYRVEALLQGTLQGVNTVRFVGSAAEAASRRAALVKSGMYRADITTTQVEIPTNKDDLLDYLNLLMATT
jgi:hypothetical protein